MEPAKAQLQSWKRFKSSITAANGAAVKINGVVRDRFATFIYAAEVLAKGLMRAHGPPPNMMARLEQYENELTVCRELHQSMQCLVEIYELKIAQFEKHNKRAPAATLVDPEPTQVFPSLDEDPEQEMQPLFNGEFKGEMKEVKEEPTDGEMSNSNDQLPGTSLAYNGVDGQLYEEDMKPLIEDNRLHSSSTLQRFDEEEFEDIKPNPLPILPKDEDLFDDLEPLADMYCPTTGTARPLGEGGEEMEWGEQEQYQQQYQTDHLNQYDGESLNSQFDEQQRRPIEIPYHVTSKRCYLCERYVYHYLSTPEDPARRAVFLDTMIVCVSKQDKSRIKHLRQSDTRGHFCEKHISTGEELSQDQPPAAKKRRTQEFMRKIMSIGANEDGPSDGVESSKAPDGNKQTAPSTSTEVLPRITRKIFYTTKNRAPPLINGKPVDAPSTSTPNSIPAITSGIAQPSTLEKRYARKCDICKELSYPFRFSPADPTIAKKFFAELINLSEDQRDSVIQLAATIRAVVCNKHIDPASPWATAVRPGVPVQQATALRRPGVPIKKYIHDHRVLGLPSLMETGSEQWRNTENTIKRGPGRPKKTIPHPSGHKIFLPVRTAVPPSDAQSSNDPTTSRMQQ